MRQVEPLIRTLREEAAAFEKLFEAAQCKDSVWDKAQGSTVQDRPDGGSVDIGWGRGEGRKIAAWAYALWDD